MQKTMQAEGFTQIISYVLVLVAAVEGAAWAAFGASFWSKTVFIAWAVAMVWTRPWLVNTRILALAHGNEKLAASAATWLKVSLAITAFSLFSLYSESMESYKAQRIAESAPVLAAASRMEQAQGGLQRIKEGARFNDGEISAAVADNTRLQAELQAAQAKAQAAFAAQKTAVQSELAAFWDSQHSNGFRYAELLDAQCKPLSTRYGPMKSAAAELCPRLQAIQKKMPDVAADSEVRRIEAEIAKLAPVLNLHQSIEAAKLAVTQAEEELHTKQSESRVASGTDVYPPVFHRLSNLTGGNMTADNLVSVFGMLGILLLLFSLNLFQEGRLLCMQGADGHIIPEAERDAKAWLSGLLPWKRADSGTPGWTYPEQANMPRSATGTGRPSTGTTPGQDDRYQHLKQAIADGAVSNLSFGNLKRAGYGDNATIRRYRDALVAEGIAEYTEHGECILKKAV